MQVERQRSRARKWRFQVRADGSAANAWLKSGIFLNKKKYILFFSLSFTDADFWSFPCYAHVSPAASQNFVWSQPLLVQKVNIWEEHLSWDKFRTLSEAALMSFSTSCSLGPKAVHFVSDIFPALRQKPRLWVLLVAFLHAWVLLFSCTSACRWTILSFFFF